MEEPSWFRRFDSTQRNIAKDQRKRQPPSQPGNAQSIDESFVQVNLADTVADINFPVAVKDVVYTCGCGHLGAELLCSLLRLFGIGYVLDVRELDHSTKRPWFNSDLLLGTMLVKGLQYKYIGSDHDDAAWANLVAGQVLAATAVSAPVCLLGVRAIALECPRLRLCQRLFEQLQWSIEHLHLSTDVPPKLHLFPVRHSDVFSRAELAKSHVITVTESLERTLGLFGSWQDRIRSRYKVVDWETWDKRRQFPQAGEEPMAIQLPWDTLLLVVPDFLSKAEIYSLQQSALPGAIDYEQPRRQVRNPDGTFTHFNESHKEAWLSDGYDYRDTRRVAPPRVHPGQRLQPWARKLLERASQITYAAFNGIMCRWEPRGVHLKDGPHTYSTHCGWGVETVVGLMAVGCTRVYHIHGIPWFHGRGRKEVVVLDMPLVEGTLMALGGPIKERFLYAQPRDEDQLPERIQFTLQLHADLDVAKGAAAAESKNWTEDCVGLSLSINDMHTGDTNAVQLASSTTGRRARWHRRAPEDASDENAGSLDEVLTASGAGFSRGEGCMDAVATPRSNGRWRRTPK